MSNAIHFILTGGTIEKSYDPTTEKPEFRKESLIPEYLTDFVKAHPDMTFQKICQIDSSVMTDEIRSDILDAVKKTQQNKIIIVHGTSTMTDTAEYLAQHLGQHNKTIVLTGAMIPLKEFAMSDGGFNLGFAVAKVLTVASGVYVAMNARLFKSGSVVKNVTEGRFYNVPA